MTSDRLLGILTILLRQGRATAPELAARFEVSRRTINRDIDRLCQAGIPVESRAGYGGGFSIREGYRLPEAGEAPDVGNMLTQLSRKLCCSAEFPHEIGVFLGYPLGDVVGFIENRGKNFTKSDRSHVVL